MLNMGSRISMATGLLPIAGLTAVPVEIYVIGFSVSWTGKVDNYLTVVFYSLIFKEI